MSNQFLKLRRSAVPGKIPDTGSLDLGEIALNTHDGLAFMKKSVAGIESVVTIGNTTGSFTGSFSGEFTGSLLGTASWAYNAVTASTADDFYVRGNITGSNALITGTLTAQRLVVQTISSSVIYSSGSNIFGDELTDTQQFTGSVTVTGSLSLNGDPVVTQIPYNAFSSSIQLRATNLESTASVLTLASSSFAQQSGSNSIRLTNLESTASILTQASASFSSSIALLSGSFLTFSASYNTGSFTGSFTGVGNLTGSLFGTASWARNAVTASHAPTALSASYAISSSNASTASFALIGNGTFSGSFSGSFFGNGAGLTNISASSVVGLNLSLISSGSVTASTDPAYGFRVNSNTQVSGSTQITGSLGVTGSVSISGSIGNIFSANVDTLAFTGSLYQTGSSFFTGSVSITGSLTVNGPTVLNQGVCVNGDISGSRLIIGSNHTMSGACSSIAAGFSNRVTSACSFIGGGSFNTGSGAASFVGGGQCNRATNSWATVAGGINNTASGANSFVGSGQLNCSTNTFSTIGGGNTNVSSGTASTVGGGELNCATNSYTTIAGGLLVSATGLGTTAVGGRSNTASGNYSSVVGGSFNTGSGTFSFVGGGQCNVAAICYSVVNGGFNNRAQDCFTSVGGGIFNCATEGYATVAGGYYNCAGCTSFVGGGDTNKATGNSSAIAAGISNTVSGCRSFIGSGDCNTVSGNCSVVVGGQFNTGSGPWSFVGSGCANIASGCYTAIVGGKNNSSSGIYTFIGGGGGSFIGNTGNCILNSNYSSIVGGRSNTISNQYSCFSFIGGGTSNSVCSCFSAVVSGESNCASGSHSLVAGGRSNTTSECYTAILGGCNNVASQPWAGAFGCDLNANIARHFFVNNLMACSNITGSNALITGTLTVQNIVAQTITSSTEFVTGSTIFGSQLTDTHQFTGSVNITGSLTVAGYSSLTGSFNGQGNLTGSFKGQATLTGSFTGSFSGLLSGSFSGSVANIDGQTNFIAKYDSPNSIDSSVIYQSASHIAINETNFTVGDPEALYVFQTHPTSFNVVTGKGNTNTYLQLNIQNTNQGISASSDIVATANNGNEFSNYIDMGINSQNFNTGFIGEANDAYVYSIANNLHIGNAATNGTHLGFFVGGDDVEANMKLQLNPNNRHVMSGSLSLTGSLNVLEGITGSLYGTSSWAISASHAPTALSSSYAISASYAISSSLAANSILFNGTSSGVFATTGSNIFKASQTIDGNLFMSGAFRLIYNDSPTNNMLFGMFDGGTIHGPYYQLFGNQYSNVDQRGSAEFVYDNRNGGGSGFNIASFNGSTWTRKFRVDDNGAQITGSLNVTGGITGSLYGTASWAENALTSSNVLGGLATYVPLWNTDTSLTSSYIYQTGNTLKTRYNNTDRGLTLDYNFDSFILGNPGVGNSTYLQVFDGGSTINVYSPNYTYFNDKVGVRIIPTNPGLAVSGSLEVTGPGLTKFINTDVQITGSLNVANGITGSLFGTASWAQNAVTSSHTLFAVSASYAATASSADNFLVRQNVTASNALITGTLTAQTIIAQYITSSTEFITGSTKFGTQLTDTHQFTGSVTITGSLSLNNSPVVTDATFTPFSSSVSTRVTNLESTASVLTTASASFALVSASYSAFSQSYNTGSFTGSFTGIGNLTGSLFGTASWANNASTASFVLNAVSASFATTSSYTISSSLAANSILLNGTSSGVFATTGSNVFVGNQTVTGSLFTSGSNTLVGSTTLTGSLNITGSTVQIGNNTLLGNTTLSGSIIMSGSFASVPTIKIFGDVQQNGYTRFDPVTTNINTSISASYIFVSGSTQDLYFSQNGKGYSNVTRLRWLEGNMYTGLLNGGLITSQSSTTYQVGSGSGIIVNLNASLNDNPYPTITYVNWPNLTGNINQFSASYDQTFVAISTANTLISQSSAFLNGQVDTQIPVGYVAHQDNSTINATVTEPSLAYGWKQRSNVFINAFGPLKLSGFNLAVSGSSTGSLIVGSGTAFLDGGNYQTDPNNPSYVTATGTNTSKIFRYYESGSDWVYQTNGAAGFATIDPARYSNNGTLTSVGAGNWSIQRVFFFPTSPLSPKPIVVYYGNAIYATEAEAIANIPIEPFTEAPSTSAAAIYLGAIVISGNGVFTNSATYKIVPGGLFRQVGGSGGGGSLVTQTLAGLSDVNISGPTNGQPLVYNSTSNKWQNSSTLTATLTGNASTATTASFALTASYVLNAVSASYALSASSAVQANTASYVLQAVSASYALNATTASFANQASTASYVLQAVSSSFASTASFVQNAQTASFVLNAVSASYAATASSADDFLIRQNVTASNALITGTLTAQTIIAQYITSSTEFITGSTKFGTLLTDTHQFTGSVTVTGSLSLNNSPVITDTTFTPFSSSVSTRVTNLESTASVLTTASASFAQQSGSNSIRLTNLESTASVLTTASASFAIVSSSFATTSASLSTRVTTLENASASFAQQSGSNSIRLTNLETTASVLTVASASFAIVSASYSALSGSFRTGSYTGSFTGTLFGTASWANNAVTSSHALFTVSASFAATASSADNFLIRQNATASNLLVNNTITAQTLVVQTVTSSIVYSSGSNIFGSQLTDVQQMTGSLRVTGSGNHYIMGGNVGFGTLTPNSPVEIAGSLNSGRSLIRITNTDTSNYITIGAGIPGISNAGTNFTLDGTSRAVISAGGNFGVNNISPVYKLDVAGDANITANLTATGSIRFPSLSNANQLNVVGYNTSTGELFYQTTSSLNVTTASYALTASAATTFTIQNQLIFDGTLTDYASVASSVAGSNNLFTQTTGSYTSAFFKYTVTNSTNARTGEVLAVWNGASVQFTDNSTLDIGSTTPVTCSVSLVGGDVLFNVQTNTSGWRIKSIGTFM